MSERGENPKEYRIRPIVKEEYSVKNKKYDGKMAHYHGWEKAIKIQIRKGGNGDIIEDAYYEIEKPTGEIEKLRTGKDEKGKDIKLKDKERMQTTVQRWMEQAERVKKSALQVMSTIEDTLTIEAWQRTQHIQEDEKITERERAKKTLDYFKEANDKYNQKSVEEAEDKLREMGTCKTRRDVEMMIAQVEAIQMTLETIPAAFIMRSGSKEIQEHKKTDKVMNTHIIERLPPKSMWENLKAEVATRDTDMTLGAYTTEELKKKITAYIETYTMSHAEREEEEQDNRTADKEPQKRRRIEEKIRVHEEKQKQVNTSKMTDTQLQTKRERRDTTEIDCMHYKYNNCRNGDNCKYKHGNRDNARKISKDSSKKTTGGGKRGGKEVNTVKIKRKRNKGNDSDSSDSNDTEEEEDKIRRKKGKTEARKKREKQIEEMTTKIRKLKEQNNKEEEESEEYMSE